MRPPLIAGGSGEQATSAVSCAPREVSHCSVYQKLSQTEVCFIKHVLSHVTSYERRVPKRETWVCRSFWVSETTGSWHHVCLRFLSVGDGVRLSSCPRLLMEPVISRLLEFLQRRHNYHCELGLDLTEASEGQLHGPLSIAMSTHGKTWLEPTPATPLLVTLSRL